MADQRLRGIGMTSRRTRDRLVAGLAEQGISDPEVLRLIRDMPRHLFLDEALASRAYEDTALPIGLGQTLSRPSVVARMTEALIEGAAPRRVLEVGTGSGYQTAILAQLASAVFTVERAAPLLEQARSRLHRFGMRNIRFRHSDGGWGWPEQAPFDGILVTAAPAEVPAALIDQLAEGGRMVIPIGAEEDTQQLLSVERRADGIRHRDLGPVSFVSLREGAE